MVYQLISLNVAVNSYDHALLTLLVSNQFVEIKGSVFKKFEKDNLFQITCADIVERFTLALMLTVVAFRNLIELSGSEFDMSEGFVLPKSFGWFKGNNVLWTISYVRPSSPYLYRKFAEQLHPRSKPVLTVMVSEMLVDWLKHAFITKFNHIRPSVYERYTDVLCRDLASGSAVGRRGARKVSITTYKSSNGGYIFDLISFPAHIRRSITLSCTPARLRFASISGPCHPNWLAIPQPNVQLKFRRVVTMDCAFSDKCRNCSLSEMGHYGCFILALVCTVLITLDIRNH
jgi:Eukaryotic membrane protein family